MPEYFIVTFTNEKGTFEADFQIPAQTEISVLAATVLEFLKTLDEHEFGHWKDIEMSADGRVLQGFETFAGSGIFDGSRVCVTQK